MKDKLKNGRDIEIAFDVGHSSIGWAVLERTGNPEKEVEMAGCGAVVFRADDCLASSRRAYRRQRRNIRSTRQRIARMKLLLEEMGVMTRAQLDEPGCAWPWKSAARVLNSKSGANEALLLSWPELWDVLRWYAHNRGYDGNRRWSGGDEPDEDTKKDMEKVENANALMMEHSTSSMAETVCAISGIDPLGSRSSCNVSPEARFKGKNAAFPRDVVEEEVRRILERHIGKLRGVDEKLIAALFKDWRAIDCPAIQLPKRYQGGLLFGQLVPRFDNRIISKCPITGEKVPSRNTREFLDFRWAMQMANVEVAVGTEKLRKLNADERAQLDKEIRAKGKFTEEELKEAVRRITGCSRNNLETMLMHPDAKKALMVDPVTDVLTSTHWEKLFPTLSERVRKRAAGKLWHFKEVSLGELRDSEVEFYGHAGAFDAELSRIIEASNTRKKKKDQLLTVEAILGKKRCISKLKGRAAYSRAILKQAYTEVMEAKWHPKEERGCLFRTEAIRKRELNRRTEQQTNNHLVRHRLLILERVLADLVKEYAGGEKNWVKQVTIEVNRELREMSGKTAKQIKQDLGLRLANHSDVVAKLEEAIEGTSYKITAGLIRKARIAEDLGWKCPYTGKQFEPVDLITKRVDKDHIVPRSLRPTDSLESLILTYREINAWKGKRTALQFVHEEGGKPVPGVPELSVWAAAKYREFVDKLESFKGHNDDKERKKKRKKLLLLEKYEEKEFMPGDLTATSQLVRLGAQKIQKAFAGCTEQPVIVSLPGSVTGSVRKSWNLLGCLAAANPEVCDAEGHLRTKTEIRDITHLHHALDATVLAFAAHFIPNNGRVWEMIVKRTLSPAEQAELKRLKLFQVGENGRFQLRDLRPEFKEEIRQRLSEKRVVQHIPARMDGLHAEQNVWRVLEQKEDGQVTLCQYRRGPDGKRVEVITREKAVKLIGPNPDGGNGKLKKLKGALVIPDNFGVALDPTPTIIPFHKVPSRLAELRKANGNRPVRVIRNGQLIRVPTGIFAGVWKVFSVKNNSFGIALDIGHPDVVRLKNKTEGHKINVRLSSLISGGMTVSKSPFTGIPSCPTTSSV